MNYQYLKSDGPNPHVARARELLKKYPELRKLMGNYPLSGLWVVLITAIQLTLAYQFRNEFSAGMLLTAFFIGALCNHGLFALIHDATHNLINKSSWSNQTWGIVCNIAQGFPSAIAFREFHIIHHADMGLYERDADLASHWEAKLVGNSTIKKTIWYFLFFLVESLRPMRLKTINMWKNPWVPINMISIVATNAVIVYFMGWPALVYLIFSTLFSVGLHPVGARWIQEHYIFDPKSQQESFSYYGPLNKTCFNVGYHVEHHDLIRIPWVHLPKLRKIAPEYYNSLKSYQSWSKLLWDFLTDKNVDLYSRYTREKQSAKKELAEAPV